MSRKNAPEFEVVLLTRHQVVSKSQVTISREVSMTYWKAARLAVFLVNTLPAIIGNPNEPSADWRISLLAAVLFGPILLLWIMAARSQAARDSNNFNDWNAPFFPLTKYPLQFWLLMSYSLLLGGGLGLITNYLFEWGNQFLAVSYLLIGSSAMLAVCTYRFGFLARRSS